jgi:hypothetical protein
MAARGRKSAASVAYAPTPLISDKRLPAPVHLTDAERDIWLSVVNDQPANAFSITHAPLLEIYCRHVIQSRILADEILNFDRAWLADDDGLKRYDRLLAMAEREGRAASSLATRLRITRQAIDQQTVARSMINAPKSKKPWEIEMT